MKRNHVMFNAHRARPLGVGLWLLATMLLLAPLQLHAQTVTPTYNCVGVKWEIPYAGPCTVEIKVNGSSTYYPVMDLWYDTRYNYYIGSIMHLRDNTLYKIRLTAGANTVEKYAQTWKNDPPEGTVTALPASSTDPLVITSADSGTASGYHVYEPAGGAAVIDGENIDAYNIMLRDAHYIIIRGLDLKNPTMWNIRFYGDCSHIIIEDCDMTNWGKLNAVGDWGYEHAAIAQDKPGDLSFITIQRNKIHDPRTSSNTWDEYNSHPADHYHPEGPMGVKFLYGATNVVVRYNEFRTDSSHKFSDIIQLHGGPSNNKGNDSDIYGNYFEWAADDAVEADHNGQNVRIFGNFFENCFDSVSFQTVSLGPTYVFRNICGKVLHINRFDSTFIKCGSTNPTHMSRLYVMHNTVLNADGDGADIAVRPVAGRYGDYYIRNNLFQALYYAMWLYPAPDTINDTDYNLYDCPYQTLYGAHDQNAAPSFSSATPWVFNASGTVDARIYAAPGLDEAETIHGVNAAYVKTIAVDLVGAGADKGEAEYGQAIFKAGVYSQSYWEN